MEKLSLHPTRAKGSDNIERVNAIFRNRTVKNYSKSLQQQCVDVDGRKYRRRQF